MSYMYLIRGGTEEGRNIQTEGGGEKDTTKEGGYGDTLQRRGGRKEGQL